MADCTEKVKCPSFRTVTDSYAAVPYISDHYPVTALLEF